MGRTLSCPDRWLPAAAGALLAACSGSGVGLDENGRPLGESGIGDLVPTIESIQDRVFTPRCSGCHVGAAAPRGLQLTDAETSYSMLVGVRSSEFPDLFRVSVGNPDDSYLIHKLEGTQEVGERMPRGGPYLDSDTISVIRTWIELDAPPPGTDGAMP